MKEMAFNMYRMVIIRQDKNTYKCNAIICLIASITSVMEKVHIYQSTAAICYRLQKNGLIFQLIGSDIVSGMCQYKEVSIGFDFVLYRMLWHFNENIYRKILEKSIANYFRYSN